MTIVKHKIDQKYDNFVYLSTKFWLKSNDNAKGILPQWLESCLTHTAE